MEFEQLARSSIWKHMADPYGKQAQSYVHACVWTRTSVRVGARSAVCSLGRVTVMKINSEGLFRFFTKFSTPENYPPYSLECKVATTNMIKKYPYLNSTEGWWGYHFQPGTVCQWSMSLSLWETQRREVWPQWQLEDWVRPHCGEPCRTGCSSMATESSEYQAQFCWY